MRNKFLFALLLVFAQFNLNGQTTTVTQNAPFESDSNSMWGASGSPIIEDEISLFHIDINQSINTGSSGIVTIIGQSFGGAFQGSISGQFGSKIKYNFNSGSIDVKYPVDVDITYPMDQTYDQGDTVTVSTSYTVLDSSELATIYPNGEVKWDLYFQLGASASATVCAFGCFTFPIIPAFNTGLININLFTISSSGATTGPNGGQGASGIWYLGPGAMPPYFGGDNEDYPGTQPTLYGSFFPYSVPPASVDASGGLGTIFEDWIPWQIYIPLILELPDNDFGLSAYVTLPYVFTESELLADNTLSACGDSTYFEVALEVFDLLGYILQQAPPGTPVNTAGQVLSNLSGTFDPLDEVGYGGLATLQWNFFSASFILDITNNQCFDFDPKIYGSLQFPFPVEYQVFHNGVGLPPATGSIVNIEIGDSLRYKFPCYFEEVTFVPTYTIVGQISNHTWDEIALRFDLSALAFGLELAGFTIVPGFTIPSVCFPLPYPCPTWSNPFRWCTTTICTPEIVVPSIGFPGFAAWTSSSGIVFGSELPDPLDPLWEYSLPIASITYDWFNETWTLPGFEPIVGDTIRMRSSLLGISNVLADVTCNGGNDGSIEVTTSALSPASPFSYTLWNNGVTTTSSVTGNTLTYSSLTEGSYQISVIDNNGCQMYTGGIVQEPLPVELSAIEIDKSCFGGTDDGSIEVVASGGSGVYNVSWTGAASGDPVGNEILVPGGSFTISNIPNGNYTVTVTDTNSCAKTETYTIEVPSALGQVGIASNVNCFGDTTGSVDVTTFGGTLPYTFAWNTTDTTEDISGLGGGSYTLTVTDARNCTNVATYTVNQPLAPLQLSISGTDVNCFGGSDGTVNLTAVGGTPGYSYEWSNAAGIILPMSTEDLVNVQASTYTATVSDSRGCTASISQSVSQPSAPLTSAPLVTNVNCFGQSTGTIDPVIAGGTAPYFYNWSNGATTAVISGLTAGMYTLQLSDSRACTANYTYEVTQPGGPLVVSLTGIDILCNGEATGSVSSLVTGGTPGYTYLWSNGITAPSISGLTAGNYTLDVTDSKGCTASNSTILNQPAQPLSASSTAVDVSCHGGNNGSIDLTVSGGTAPYNYVWSNAQALILTGNVQDLSNLTSNTYSVSITDNNGCQTSLSQVITQPSSPLAISGTVDDVNCFGISDGSVDVTVTGGTPGYTYNWSNGAMTQDISSISSGTYTILATDQNGCTLSMPFTVNQPNAALAVTLTPESVACNGGSTGSVSSFVEGGTPGYTYNWSNGATSADIEDLTAGIYTLTVTDVQGCTAFSGTVVSEPANALTVVVTVNDPSCFGYDNGSIQMDITGGTQPYYFNWGNENEILLNNPSETLTDISAGSYLFRVRDASGCMFEQIVNVNQPTLLTVSHVVSDALCFGDSTGVVDLTIAGATPPYTVVWSNGMLTEDAVNVPSGNYSYVVTDAQGCEYSSEAFVDQPNALNIEYSIVGVSCIDQTDGEITVVAYGGTPAYDYVWDNGATNPSIAELAPGTYVLTLSDDNLCTQNFSFVIESNPDECVGIPNTFSPNGDDYNDTWILENLDLYPNASVKIFNKWGNLLFSSEGAYTPWDGTHNGNELPSEVYYYIITLGNAENNQYTGTITIVR